MLTPLLYFFIAIIAIQVIYYLFIFTRFAFVSSKTKSSVAVSVSVIVCSKNDEKNIIELVPLLANQDYPDFEIILIDDASTDETLTHFKRFEKEYSNIRIVKIVPTEAFWGNKKYALTLGIKSAQKDYLLFIEPNCLPKTNKWISEISSGFSEKKTIVLGYSAFKKVRFSLLNILTRHQSLFSAVQYFSWAKLGHPYMGISRNMGYKKDEFFKINGFISHMRSRFGDDDLFINQASNSKNTDVVYSPSSFTYAAPHQTYSDWFKERRKYLFTANSYKFFDKFQLSIFNISQVLFFVVMIFELIFEFDYIELLLLLIGIRYFIVWLVIGISSVKLREKSVIFWFPITEIINIIIQSALYIINIFSKPLHWK